MAQHNKGWKRQQRPGYVKSHDAVKNGASRDPQKAAVNVLTEQEHVERGWKPALATDVALLQSQEKLNEYVKELKATTGGTVYLPPTVNADGTIENISQFKTVTEGPEQGHWANVNGRRIWIKGQHNYNRQQNPKSHEHVNQTNVMNRNTRLQKLGDEQYNELTGKRYVLASKNIEPEARIVRYGRVVNVKKAPGCAVERAVERAMKHIQNKTANFLEVAANHESKNLAADNSLESQVQSAAGSTISPVGVEAHVR